MRRLATVAAMVAMLAGLSLVALPASAAPTRQQHPRTRLTPDSVEGCGNPAAIVRTSSQTVYAQMCTETELVTCCYRVRAYLYLASTKIFRTVVGNEEVSYQGPGNQGIAYNQFKDWNTSMSFYSHFTCVQGSYWIYGAASGIDIRTADNVKHYGHSAVGPNQYRYFSKC
jgi:hypothetical protein